MEEIEITFDHETFDMKLAEMVEQKKTFFAFVFAAHGEDGKSWCPDTILSEPFVNKAKEDYVYKNKDKDKEIIFVNIPVVKSERSDYTNSKIVKLTRIPSLIFFLKGIEIKRIVEGEMATQESVSDFISQAYKNEE